jgi:hypothetical protein
MITLNILANNRAGLLPLILKECVGYFDKIRVIDGSEDKRITNACRRFHAFDIDIIDFQWRTLSLSLNALISRAGVGEWFFYIADDELPSQLLLEHLYNIIRSCEQDNSNMVSIPFTVRHDGFNSEDMKTYIHQARDEDNTAGNGEKFRLGRLFKVFEGTKFGGDTHEGISGYDYVIKKTEYPIIHIKESDEFYLGNLWTSVINPEGQGLSGDSLLAFKSGVADSNLTRNQEDIELAISKDLLSDSMMDWISNFNNADNAVEFSWYSVYYFKYHPDKIVETDFINDKKFHKWFDIFWHYSDTEYISQTTMDSCIKNKMMDHGLTTICDFRSYIWRKQKGLV